MKMNLEQSIEQAVDVVNRYPACKYFFNNNYNYCLDQYQLSDDDNDDCSCCPHKYTDAELDKALITLFNAYKEYEKERYNHILDGMEDFLMAYYHGEAKLECSCDYCENLDLNYNSYPCNVCMHKEEKIKMEEQRK